MIPPLTGHLLPGPLASEQTTVTVFTIVVAVGLLIVFVAYLWALRDTEPSADKTEREHVARLYGARGGTVQAAPVSRPASLDQDAA